MKVSASRDDRPAARGDWFVLSEPGAGGRDTLGADGAPPSQRALLTGLAVAAVLAVAVVLGASVVVARQIAEAQAVAEAARTAQLLGDVVAEPALTDALLDGDAGARAEFDEVIRRATSGSEIVRVKLWTADGTIVYSDEPRLVGETFALDDEERKALASGGVDAEVSNLRAPENRFETGNGELLEAYHAVSAPTGRTALFEAYFRYDDVLVNSRELWLAFSALAAGSILVLLVLLTPIAQRVLRALRDARAQRERLLQHALDASSDERRRIAARLHDGAIQDLTAGALLLGGGAARLRRTADGDRNGDARLVSAADELDSAATTLRAGVSGLRSLLVDVYPPTLGAAGIGAALDDLATVVRGRGVKVTVEVDPAALEGPAALDGDESRLVFRMVRECLANTVRHARATRAVVTIGPPADPTAEGVRMRVEVRDDGVGFDPATLARPAEGHIGVPLLAEAVTHVGGRLSVRSAGGAGTAGGGAGEGTASSRAASAGVTPTTSPGDGTVWRLDLFESMPHPGAAARTTA